MIVDNRRHVTNVKDATVTLTREELEFLRDVLARFTRRGRWVNRYWRDERRTIRRTAGNKRLALGLTQVFEGILS